MLEPTFAFYLAVLAPALSLVWGRANMQVFDFLPSPARVFAAYGMPGVAHVCILSLSASVEGAPPYLGAAVVAAWTPWLCRIAVQQAGGHA